MYTARTQQINNQNDEIETKIGQITSKQLDTKKAYAHVPKASSKT